MLLGVLEASGGSEGAPAEEMFLGASGWLCGRPWGTRLARNLGAGGRAWRATLGQGRAWRATLGQGGAPGAQPWGKGAPGAQSWGRGARLARNLGAGKRAWRATLGQDLGVLGASYWGS